jgi:hypothetical protein
MQFMLCADLKRYETLLSELENAFVRGWDEYPKTLTSAYEYLVAYRPPKVFSNNTGQTNNNQEIGMTYATIDDNQDSGNKNRTSSGKNGGSNSGNSSRQGSNQARNSNSRQGGSRNGQASIQDVREEDEVVNVVSNTNTESNDYALLDEYDISHVACLLQGDHHVLPSNWLLLDSCSSVDIVMNRELLSDIRKVNTPIRINCNSGYVVLDQQGKLGNYTEPVWFHPCGITNLISLHHVKRHFQLTMDTAQTDAIFLHSKDGKRIPFTPSEKGIYKYILPACQNITDLWNLLSSTSKPQETTLIDTVEDRSKYYTKREIQQAQLARRIQNKVGCPSSKEFQDVVIHHLPGCTVTVRDIQIAEDLYGPNLASLKGKTVRTTAPHIDGKVSGVPPKILSRQSNIVLCIDIAQINGIEAFLTVSKVLRFGTIDILPNRQTKTFRDILTKIVRHYESRGFTIQTIFGDPAFRSLKAWFPQFDSCGADDHVPDIERYIRTWKERVRSGYHSSMFPVGSWQA